MPDRLLGLSGFKRTASQSRLVHQLSGELRVQAGEASHFRGPSVLVFDVYLAAERPSNDAFGASLKAGVKHIDPLKPCWTSLLVLLCWEWAVCVVKD